MDEILTAKDVAAYLKLNERTVLKYASEHKLPAVKVGGQWRFKREVLDRWLESRMQPPDEQVGPGADGSVTVSDLLVPELVLTGLEAVTGDDVLLKLVEACVDTGRVRDGRALFGALLRREQLCSTALGRGVAFPHVRESGLRLADGPIVALAQVPHGVDFRSSDGGPTYLFFMVYSPSTRVHLRVLARLTHLVRDEAFVAGLREVPDAPSAVVLVRDAEFALQPMVGASWR